MGSEGKSYIGSLRTKIEIYLEHWMIENEAAGLAAWQTVGSYSVSPPS